MPVLRLGIVIVRAIAAFVTWLHAYLRLTSSYYCFERAVPDWAVALIQRTGSAADVPRHFCMEVQGTSVIP